MKSHGKIMIDQFDESRLVPIESLKPHPHNPNMHSQEQLDTYAAVLQFSGIRQAVRVSKRSGYVTKGHGQMYASKRNGWTHVPVEYQDYETDDQELADLVADNALARQADMDYAVVHQMIPSFDPSLDLKVLAIPGFVVDPSEKSVSFTAKQGSKEIGADGFDKFDHKCPRCQFEFDDEQ